MKGVIAMSFKRALVKGTLEEFIIIIALTLVSFIGAVIGYLLYSSPLYDHIKMLMIGRIPLIGAKIATEVFSVLGFGIADIVEKLILYIRRENISRYRKKRIIITIRTVLFVVLLFISIAIGLNLANENASLSSITPDESLIISESQKDVLDEHPSITVIIDISTEVNDSVCAEMIGYKVVEIGPHSKTLLDCFLNPFENLFDWIFGTESHKVVQLEPVYDNIDPNSGSDSGANTDDTGSGLWEGLNDIQEHHFVIMYDVSKSMETSDPNDWVKDSVAQFINRINPKVYPIKLAILPFAGECPAAGISKPSDNRDWFDIENHDSEVLGNLTKEIQKLEYAYSNTDIGKAFEECNRILEEMSDGVDKNYAQTVLFVTDGFIDTTGLNINDKFVNIERSYRKVLEAADNFPTDALFIGIVPDDNMREALLTFSGQVSNGKREVVVYYTYDVPTDYGYKVEDYTKCVSTFVNSLKKRQGGRVTSNVYEVNWGNKNISSVFDDIYNKIFEDKFNTSTNRLSNEDLDSGISFYVSEIVNDLTIIIRSSATDYDVQRADIEKWRSEVSITRNGEACEFDTTYTDYAIIVNIKNINTGIYTLKCNGARFSDLLVNAYGRIGIQACKTVRNGMVGEKITFSGTINIPKDLQDYITVEAYSSMDEETASTYATSYKDGIWKVSFIPEEEGVYNIYLKVVYNDTEFSSDSSGISIFQATKELTAYVEAESNLDNDSESTDNPSTIIDESGPFDEWLKNTVIPTLKTYWPVCVLAVAMLIIGVSVILRITKHRFTVILPDGVHRTYYAPKSTIVLEPRKFRKYGLRVSYLGDGLWKYSSSGAPTRTIRGDEVIRL